MNNTGIWVPLYWLDILATVAASSCDMAQVGGTNIVSQLSQHVVVTWPRLGGQT